MKQLKKVISSILALAIFMSLAACSDPGANSPNPSDSATPPATNNVVTPSDGGDAAGGDATPDSYNWPKFINFLGASAGGNAILSMNALTTILSDNLPSTFSAQVTPGASQNMYLMDQGDGNYAWGSAYGIYCINNGLESYAENPIPLKMNTILMYSATTWQIAVRKGSGITCVEDLRGQRVVVGAPGGGTESAIRTIMSILGLYDGNDYDFKAEYSGVSEGCELIANGQADAILVGGSIPFSSYMELFVSDKIELIGLTDSEVAAILEYGGGYQASTIPAGSYEGKVTEDLKSVSSFAGVICRADCDEDEVYWITRTICEHWEELGAYHDMFNLLTAQEAAQNAQSTYADIHPGALRYYQEMGWM